MNAASNRVASMSIVRWWCLPLAACALLAPPAFAQSVHRCEDNAGRITYSNEACPPGTRRSRAVDTSEPVVGATRAAAAPAAAPAADKSADNAQADKDKSAAKADDKADAKADADRSGDKSAAAERRPRAAEGKLAARTAQIDRTPSQPAAPVSVQKDAMCRDLATRARFARQDLESALPSQRASAELSLRRAQEEHDAECRTR
jgi:colicin import membrane protein